VNGQQAEAANLKRCILPSLGRSQRVKANLDSGKSINVRPSLSFSASPAFQQ
jgi:hypothetical protein